MQSINENDTIGTALATIDATLPAAPLNPPVPGDTDDHPPVVIDTAVASPVIDATIANADKPTSPSNRKQRKAAAKAAPKPAAKPVKPVSQPVPVSFGGFSGGNVARTAQTVAADRTHFGGTTSSRDEAYLALFATVAAEANDKRTVTLTALAAKATNHFYDGSAKPHDAGAINRARKAGNIIVASDGSSLKLSKRGAELAANVLAKLRPAKRVKPAASPASEPAT